MVRQEQKLVVRAAFKVSTRGLELGDGVGAVHLGGGGVGVGFKPHRGLDAADMVVTSLAMVFLDVRHWRVVRTRKWAGVVKECNAKRLGSRHRVLQGGTASVRCSVL